VFYGVTSPGSTGTQHVTIRTTSDPVAATLTYTLLAQR
jgi:hypothetical protein